MNFQNILTSLEKQTAVITINRPKQLNALNKTTIEEISNALSNFRDNNEVRVVIITGVGDKAFVAGADIKEFADFNIDKGKDLAPYIKIKFETIKKVKITWWDGGSMGRENQSVTYGLLETNGKKILLPLINHIDS